MLRISFLLLLGLLCLGQARSQGVGDVSDRMVSLQETAVTSAGKTAQRALRSTAIDGAFTGVVLRVHATHDAVEGQIRFEDSDGWSAWLPLRFFPFGTGVFMASYRSEIVRSGGRFEVRLAQPGAEAPGVVEAGVFDARADADRQRTPSEGAAASSPTTLPAPRVIRRSEWNARPYNCGTPSVQPYYNYLTLHHTAGAPAATLGEGIQRMHEVQDFHIDGRGWCDVGYHFLVDSRGDIFQGRPFADESKAFSEAPQLVIGAHAGGNNTGNIGISLMGCYHPPEGASCTDVITPAALDSVVTLMTFLADAYGIEPHNIRGHRDWNSTACPGDNNYRLLDDIRRAVEQRLQNADLDPLLPVGYTLRTNFPNPFSTETTIRYFLHHDGSFPVRLEIYDALGRLVAAPVDAPQQGGRWYEVSMDSAGLTAGVYYYRLRVEGYSGIAFEETRSMALVP